MTLHVRQPGPRQENDNVPWLRVAFSLFIVLAVAGALVLWAISMRAAREAEFRPSRTFPEAALGPRHRVSRVQQDLFAERALGLTLKARQRAALEHYAWVDKSRGIIRIPIERAMDLRVQEAER